MNRLPRGPAASILRCAARTEEAALLQDLLLHATKAIAQYAHRARKLGARDARIDRFLLRGLFLTVTNVNFDGAALEKAIRDAAEMRDLAKALYERAARKANVAPEDLRRSGDLGASADRAELAGRATSYLCYPAGRIMARI